MSNNHDEDTEWNDILRAKGIIPQKEAQITEADIIDMIDEAILKRDAKNYDEKTVDELDELLDEGNEDEERMLMEYRYPTSLPKPSFVQLLSLPSQPLTFLLVILLEL